MKNIKRVISLCVVLSMLAAQTSWAQKSYIYIELIKAIPCRVLQNGKEVTQLNKNYVLLNVSEQREQNIDIEFGAGLYPKQNFVIDAMPDAAYAYKLARSGETSFYLLDLVNNGKIIESNSKVNIGLPTDLNKINFGKDQEPNTQKMSGSNGSWVKRLWNVVAFFIVRKRNETPDEQQKESKKEAQNDLPPASPLEQQRESNKEIVSEQALETPAEAQKEGNKEVVSEQPVAPPVEQQKEGNKEVLSEPPTVSSVEAKDSNKQAQSGQPAASPVEQQKENSMEVVSKPPSENAAVKVMTPNENTAQVKNPEVAAKPAEAKTPEEKKPVQPLKPGCRHTASDAEAAVFAEKVASKRDEEAQLLLARKKQFTGCLTVKQIIQIGENYKTQHGKFNFIKIMLNNVANPLELPQCESLFKSQWFKNKLIELIDSN